jgi:hypothetical protein
VPAAQPGLPGHHQTYNTPNIGSFNTFSSEHVNVSSSPAKDTVLDQNGCSLHSPVQRTLCPGAQPEPAQQMTSHPLVGGGDAQAPAHVARPRPAPIHRGDRKTIYSAQGARTWVRAVSIAIGLYAEAQRGLHCGAAAHNSMLCRQLSKG